jgi:3-oxoacyl-[acyl-carrier protein] reductase
MNSIFSPEALSGKNALVTGGAGGIGRAIAEHLAAAGARVVLADRNTEVHDLVKLTGAVGAVIIDVTDEASVTVAVAEAITLLGRIDILVNSHGILTEALLEDMTSHQWRETLDVDLTSIFLLCRAVLPGMLERQSGRIINIASQLALKGGIGLAHYVAAKAGVIGLTKSLALEVSSRGVLVNAVAPGPIDTALLADISEAPTVVLLASDPGGNLYVGQTLGPNSGDVMP